VAQRQQQPRPWTGTERHHRDPLPRDESLPVEDVEGAIRQREIEPRRPHTRAKPVGIAEIARRNAVRQRQPVQPTGQQFVGLRRDRHRPAIRLEFAVARLRLDGETRAGHAVADRHDRYSRFCRAGAWRRADSGR